MTDDLRNPRTHHLHPDECTCLMCTVWGKDRHRPGVYPDKTKNEPKGKEEDDGTGTVEDRR